MASTLRLLPLPPPPSHRSSHQRASPTTTVSISLCCSNSNEATPESNKEDNKLAVDDFPDPSTTPSTTTFDIERRQPSVIRRDTSKGISIQRPEPPNFEIGWKRTKKITTEKPKGWMIADFLEKLESLMERGKFGSTDLLAKTGTIVAERAKEEAELLVADGKVEERLATELYRVLRLIEMDMEMVKAAVKQETLKERIEQAKARCRQAILVALSF